MRKHLITFFLALLAISCQGKISFDEITLIVPFANAGGTDKISRELAKIVSKNTGKIVSVENIVGESGFIGMKAGAEAEPDGSTVTMVTTELSTFSSIKADKGFSVDLFAPIMLVNSAYSVVTVRSDMPWEALEDIRSAASEGKVRVGNSGAGSVWHLAAVALERELEVSFSHQTYGGARPAVDALLNGDVDIVCVSYSEVSSEVQNGNLKVLAALAPERLENIPDVPIAEEEGISVEMGTWRGLVVPGGTPVRVREELYKWFSEAVASEEFRRFMKDNGYRITVDDPVGFRRKIQSDAELIQKLLYK